MHPKRPPIARGTATNTVGTNHTRCSRIGRPKTLARIPRPKWQAITCTAARLAETTAESPPPSPEIATATPLQVTAADSEWAPFPCRRPGVGRILKESQPRRSSTVQPPGAPLSRVRLQGTFCGPPPLPLLGGALRGGALWPPWPRPMASSAAAAAAPIITTVSGPASVQPDWEGEAAGHLLPLLRVLLAQRVSGRPAAVCDKDP